jgi:hypothetical protein
LNPVQAISFLTLNDDKKRLRQNWKIPVKLWILKYYLMPCCDLHTH